jgi:hypothetical protein
MVTAAGMTGAWLTDELRVFVLLLPPTAIVVSLLVLYFDWRARFLRRLLAEREDVEGIDHVRLDRAA